MLIRILKRCTSLESAAGGSAADSACAKSMGAQAGATAQRKRERKLQEAKLAIKKKFGKNVLLRGRSLLDGATGRDRNEQIGGHRA